MRTSAFSFVVSELFTEVIRRRESSMSWSVSFTQLFDVVRAGLRLWKGLIKISALWFETLPVFASLIDVFFAGLRLRLLY